MKTLKIVGYHQDAVENHWGCEYWCEAYLDGKIITDYIGDPLRFDSADEVYKYLLKQDGVCISYEKGEL